MAAKCESVKVLVTHQPAANPASAGKRGTNWLPNTRTTDAPNAEISRPSATVQSGRSEPPNGSSKVARCVANPERRARASRARFMASTTNGSRGALTRPSSAARPRRSNASSRVRSDMRKRSRSTTRAATPRTMTNGRAHCDAVAKSARSSSKEARNAVSRCSWACPRVRTSSTRRPTADDPDSARPRMSAALRSARRALTIFQPSFHDPTIAAIRSTNPPRVARTWMVPRDTPPR